MTLLNTCEGEISMKLRTEIAKKIKSIHILTKLAITAYNKKGEILKEYLSLQKTYPDIKISLDILKDRPIYVDYGNFQELFLVFSLEDIYISIGPVLTQKLEQTVFESLNSETKEYLNQIPVIASANIKEILILIDSIFNLHLEVQYFNFLKDLAIEQKKEIKTKYESSYKETRQSYCYAYHYEHRLLSLIATGDLNKVRQESAQIGASILPSSTQGSLRGEKNYAIILMEKISSFTIQMGLDIEKSFMLRDHYINKIEEQQNIIKVLTLRDSAILQFTEAVHKITHCQYSLLIRQIVQYISLHIYDSITLFDIERTFYISNASLRRRFKSEVGISIGKYIQNQKLIEAKFLLLQKIPPSIVSEKLKFHDQSHFVRIFKKYTGLTPLQFQNQKQLKADFKDKSV